MHNYPGKYIVIEGIDGAGKDTQVDILRETLPSETIFTREPRGTEAGVEIQKIIVGKDIDPVSQILLMYAARKEVLNDVIIPALKEGKTVISNRNELSTYAYQIHGHERDDLEGLVSTLSEEILGSIEPDYCVYYDISADIKKERLKGRPDQLDSFDRKAEDFFERAREGYKKHIQKYNHIVIDASGSIEAVSEKTKNALENIL